MSDLVITATGVTLTSGEKAAAIAEQAIAAGQAVYISATGGIRLSQADGTTLEAECVGIALHAAAVGQPLTYAKNGSAVFLSGATTAKTTTYMVSATAGGICPQADLVSTNKITRIGYADNTAGLFNIDIKNTGNVV
jgi:hypothetical protein